MGKVLAVIRSAAISLAFLTACGPLNEGTPAATAVDLVMSAVEGTEEPTQPEITPELAQADELLFVTVRTLGSVLPMYLAQTSGDAETWTAATGATVTLENGILVASRGLGFDVSGVDPIGVRSAIAAGGGTAQRVHGFLNALDQIDTVTLNCTITDAGAEEVEMPRGTATLTKFEEACTGRQLVFNNEYWTDQSGQVVRSVQALSPELGFLLFERT